MRFEDIQYSKYLALYFKNEFKRKSKDKNMKRLKTKDWRKYKKVTDVFIKEKETK